jgi:two-component system nitrogen regulation response regulator GlnG
LIDDDRVFSELLRESLRPNGYEVEWWESVEDSPAPAEFGRFDVLLLDNWLRGRSGKKGIEFLADLRREGVRIPVIMITEHGTPDLRIEATKLGAAEFVPKPLALVDERSLESLRQRLERAVESSRFMKERVLLPTDPGTEGTRLIGACGSGPMAEVYDLIGRAAGEPDRDKPVLITGEAGTGKDMIARVLFQHSERPGPFLKVKCGAFHDEKQLEEELFGYEGSDRRTVGKFEQAHGGAVLLDDLAETSRSVREQVLQVIHDGLVIRGGSGVKVAIDVWVIGCTSRDLGPEFYSHFRTRIHLPRLQRRGEDVDQLADEFLKRAAALEKPWVQSFDDEARAALRNYDWPGNVRELKHEIGLAVRRCQGDRITTHDLRLGAGGAREWEVSAHIRQAIHAAALSGRSDLYAFLEEKLKRELVSHLWGGGHAAEEIARRTGLPESEVSAVFGRLGIDPDPEANPVKSLSPRKEVAWRHYLWACETEPALVGEPLAKVYRWLQEKDPDDLPDTFDTFARYIRAAQAHYGCQRNGSRAGRPTGKSVVRSDEV